MKRLAIKRLTVSDLTFFESHFRLGRSGNQKAINLNADVFVAQLYPTLPELAIDVGGRFPIDLYLYGPGDAPELNLQRKITKGDTYKNWRLNGEFVYSPLELPTRFASLAPGDAAILEFVGVTAPNSVRLILVAGGVPTDSKLHTEISAFLGKRSMAAVTPAELARIIEASDLLESHAARGLLLEEDIEDTIHGSVSAAARVGARAGARAISQETLRMAKRQAEAIGLAGEELLNAHFTACLEQKILANFSWESERNAVAPYDFRLQIRETGAHVLVDAKTTAGAFDRQIHISTAELYKMRDASEEYAIYRLYELVGTTAKLRVCNETHSFAEQVLKVLDNLPKGVEAEGVSVHPSTLAFERESVISTSSDAP